MESSVLLVNVKYFCENQIFMQKTCITLMTLRMQPDPSWQWWPTIQYQSVTALPTLYSVHSLVHSQYNNWLDYLYCIIAFSYFSLLTGHLRKIKIFSIPFKTCVWAMSRKKRGPTQYITVQQREGTSGAYNSYLILHQGESTGNKIKI